jgi:hypothetical protein
LTRDNEDLKNSRNSQIANLESSLSQQIEKTDKLEQILKEVEWTHDQIRKEHQEEQFQLQSQVEELKRNSEIQEMQIRDEVEQLWRAKTVEKEAQIRKIKDEMSAEKKKFNEILVEKDFEAKQNFEKLSELRGRVISLQAENDDLSNKLTVGSLDKDSLCEKQKSRIEKLERDLESKEGNYRHQIKELTSELDKFTQLSHSKDLELSSLKDRHHYELKNAEEKLKLDQERMENSYKFQIRKLDDKIRDQEREVERLRMKDDTNLNRILDLERKLTTNTDKKDQEWKAKLEQQDRELLDTKHNLQEKSNKLYLMKEKLDSIQLNLDSKTNELKKLRFEFKEFEQQRVDLEDGNYNLRLQHKGMPIKDDSKLVKQLRDRVKELEQEIEKNKSVKKVERSIEELKKDGKIPFIDEPYNKKSKNSAFDDLGLDDDLSDNSFLREGSSLNVTERLRKMKPERDIPKDELSKELEELRQENIELKALISQMKDEMISIANNRPQHDETSGEINFLRNTNKKLLTQMSSEKEKFEIMEQELEIKLKELEIANSTITNLSKKLSLKEKDIQVLIEKLKQQKEAMTVLKQERDRFLGISNDLRGELNYVKKQGESKSETCAQDLHERQLESTQVE